ncbi:hypothetical protein N7528_009216 [Penicillium herquei]|nr:hypothetical protein N7528_009216 [Penicillium herquei]
MTSGSSNKNNLLPVNDKLSVACYESFPRDGNWFCIEEIRQVLEAEFTVDMFLSLKAELHCMATLYGELPDNAEAILPVSSADKSTMGDGSFILINDELCTACKQFLRRVSPRFKLAEIQLVLFTNPRFSRNQHASLSAQISDYLINQLAEDRFSSSSQRAFAQLVMFVGNEGNFWIVENRPSAPGTGRQVRAKVVGLYPMRDFGSNGDSFWGLELCHSSSEIVKFSAPPLILISRFDESWCVW